MHRVISNKWFQCAIAGIFAALVFLLVFGTGAVDPGNLGWIYGDPMQHYVGWMYYRATPWSSLTSLEFPYLGWIDGLAYPGGVSDIFMDICPIVALLLKLLSPLLPSTFQFFGLYNLACFFLQGFVGAAIVIRLRILRRVAGNSSLHEFILVFIGSIFFTFTPMMFEKVLHHEALASHWLLLLAVYFIIRFRQEAPSLLRFCITWSILLSLAGVVHAYFYPMMIVLLFVGVAQTDFASVWWRYAVAFITPFAAFWVVFALFGGLTIPNVGAWGLERYGFQPLSLFDSVNYSALLKPLYSYTGDDEQLNFLGISLISVIVLSAVYFIYRSIHEEEFFCLLASGVVTLRNVLSGGALLVLVIFAVGPYIHWGDKVIFRVQIPEWVEEPWSYFRANGRKFWGVYYLVMVGLIWCLFYLGERFANSFSQWFPGVLQNEMGKKTFTIIFVSLLAFAQSADILLSPAVLKKAESIKSLTSHPRVVTEMNQQLIKSECGKQHLVFLDSSKDFNEFYFFHDFADYIINCHPTINNLYFARSPKEQVAKNLEQITADVESGNADLANTVYITANKETAERLKAKYGAEKISDPRSDRQYWMLNKT